jgi:hypothetical protein
MGGAGKGAESKVLQFINVALHKQRGGIGAGKPEPHYFFNPKA